MPNERDDKFLEYVNTHELVVGWFDEESIKKYQYNAKKYNALAFINSGINDVITSILQKKLDEGKESAEKVLNDIGEKLVRSIQGCIDNKGLIVFEGFKFGIDWGEITNPKVLYQKKKAGSKTPRIPMKNLGAFYKSCSYKIVKK